MTVPDREDIEAYRHQSAEDLAAKIELINKSIRFAQCPEKDNLILSAEGKHGWSWQGASWGRPIYTTQVFDGFVNQVVMGFLKIIWLNLL